MKSGVPQVSVFCPLCFLMYIKDLVSNLESIASLFPDDAKIYKTIKTESDIETLQRDMDKLDKRSKIWLLTLNTNQLKTMHIGYGNWRD